MLGQASFVFADEKTHDVIGVGQAISGLDNVISQEQIENIQATDDGRRGLST
jgi:hypothetical protein